VATCGICTATDLITRVTAKNFKGWRGHVDSFRTLFGSNNPWIAEWGCAEKEGFKDAGYYTGRRKALPSRKQRLKGFATELPHSY